MPYTIDHIEEGNIVRVTSRGRVTMEEYMAGSKEIVDLLAKHDSTCLFVDDTELDNAASIADFYDLPDFFRQIGLSSQVRVAILLDATSSAKGDLEFFKTVCGNRGYILNTFTSFDEAMEWLMGHERVS